MRRGEVADEVKLKSYQVKVGEDPRWRVQFVDEACTLAVRLFRTIRVSTGFLNIIRKPPLCWMEREALGRLD